MAQALITKPGICKYNGMIDCQTKDNCRNCGWNPDVSRKRSEEIRAEMEEEEE